MMRIAIIGGGISGLSTAHAIQRLAAGAGLTVETIVLEKKDRLGGKIGSVKENGYLCEWGPNGFLDNKPMTLELCDRLGIKEQLLRSDDNARKRFIYSGGVLHQLPENGPGFLRSRLVSWPGKARLACEMLVPPRRDGGDESLADFARRRLGSEALDKLIAPMVAGIFAGDPETMSLKSCFPRIHELEREYGGSDQGDGQAGQKEESRNQGRQGGCQRCRSRWRSHVFSRRHPGTDLRTAAALGGEVRTDAGVVGILPRKEGFELQWRAAARSRPTS